MEKIKRTISVAGLCAFILMAVSCQPQDPRCSAAPQGGPCDPIAPKYYYDYEDHMCKPFFYECAGPVPFETLAECQSCGCE